MHLRSKLKSMTIGQFGFAAVIVLTQVSLAGSLTPPGAPASTMKTLEEVEPRTPISSIPITISEPGSYYLTGNLTGMPGTNGITIICDSVSLDLNGFALIGVPGSFRGVYVPLIPTAYRIGNLSIRNGTVRDWGLDGIYWPTASNSLVEAVRVAYNGADGTWVARGCRVANSVFTGHAGIGLRTLEACVVTDCVAVGNKTAGMSVGERCIVRNCTASRNSGGNLSPGIVIGSGTTVIDSISSFNGIGIQTSFGCIVKNNNCTDNKASFSQNSAGEGILVTFSGTRVEGNNLVNNDIGINTALSTGNWIIKNSALNNGVDYMIDPGNIAGTIVTNEAAMNAAPNSNVNLSF